MSEYPGGGDVIKRGLEDLIAEGGVAYSSLSSIRGIRT